MRVQFTTIEDGDEGSVLVQKLRDILRQLGEYFQKIRIDDAIIIGGGQQIKKHLSVTGTWDPANVAAGAQTSTTIALTGAVLGDEVTCSFSLDLQGMQLTAYVSSANTITAILRNGTAGALNLASGTLRVSLWQH